MRCIILVLAIVLTAPSTAWTQAPTSGGFLFAYRPHPDEGPAFEEGYRRHLAWHAEHGDSLAWYGWTVLAGPGLGRFVDGVFGVPFAALDVRVDPAGDAADMATNVLPHADPVHRELVRLRPGLSTATPLESGTPTPLVQVVRYEVGPAQAAVLEQGLEALHQASAELLPYTVYETLAGSRPSFLLMIWRTRLGSFDEAERDPARALRRELARRSGASGSPLTADVTDEVWRFRPDLTYTGAPGEGS